VIYRFGSKLISFIDVKDNFCCKTYVTVLKPAYLISDVFLVVGQLPLLNKLYSNGYILAVKQQKQKRELACSE